MEGACLVMSGTSGSISRSYAVGGMTTMGAVPARAVAERVLNAAVPKVPFPGELTPARAADERVLNAADPKTPFPGELTVGSMEAVPARAAAEGVEDAADPEPPFPKELTVGFPGESKAPTVAQMVHATAVAIGGLLAVDSGIEKRGGDKMVSRFPDGLGAIGVEGAVFVLLFLTVLVAWDGGALPSASGDEGACVAFLALRRGGGVAADFMVWMNSLKRGYMMN